MAAAPQRRLRAPRQLRPTRDGLFYLLLTLVVGFGATNSGNNLLFLVLGLLLATIIVSGLLSEAVLGNLEVRSRLVRPAPAGEEGRWVLAVTKTRGRFPSFAMIIESLDGPALGSRASLFRLAPGATEEVELRFAGARRGRFPAGRVRVSTRFPFGLAMKSREFDLATVLTIYPRRLPPPTAAPVAMAREGASPTGQAGRGAEPLLLRQWAPGDPLQQMHWRRSAQGRGWITSVREQERHPEVRLDVDLSASADPDSLTQLEARIERTAAEAEEAFRRGFSVGLRAGDAVLPAGLGPPQRHRILEALAAAEPKLDGGR